MFAALACGLIWDVLGDIMPGRAPRFRAGALLAWPLIGWTVISARVAALANGMAHKVGRGLEAVLDAVRLGTRVLMRDGRPVQLVSYVTARCNLRCGHCFYRETLDAAEPGELPLEVFERMTRQVGPVLWYAFAGGEPLVRDDLEEVVEIVQRNCRPRILSIPTNGWYTEKTYEFGLRVLQRMETGELMLFFSLDGPQRIHDRIRRPGSFRRVKETMERLRPLTGMYPNLHLNVTFTVTEQNADVAPEFVRKIASDFQPDAISVSLFRYHRPEHPALPDRLIEGYRAACEAYEELLRSGALRHYGFAGGRVLWWKEILQKNLIYHVAKDDQYRTPCLAGNLSYVVMEDGRVRPCEILPHTIGNVADEASECGELVWSERARNLRRRIRATRCRCTYECAMSVNTLFSWPMSGRLARAVASDFLRDLF